jgi:hypothetical protein
MSLFQKNIPQSIHCVHLDSKQLNSWKNHKREHDYSYLLSRLWALENRLTNPSKQSDRMSRKKCAVREKDWTLWYGLVHDTAELCPLYILQIFYLNLFNSRKKNTFKREMWYLIAYFPSGLNLMLLILRAKLNRWITDLLLVLHSKHSPSSFTRSISHPSGDTSMVVMLNWLSIGRVSALLLFYPIQIIKTNMCLK